MKRQQGGYIKKIAENSATTDNVMPVGTCAVVITSKDHIPVIITKDWEMYNLATYDGWKVVSKEEFLGGNND